MSDRMDESFKPDAKEQGSEQATESENVGGESGQDGPPTQEVSNAIYTQESHKYIDRSERVGLRTTDNHASWREVYRSCEVRRWRP